MPTCHRLFFALLPPPDVRRRLAAIRDAIGGRAVADDRLHVTLFVTNAYRALPTDLAPRAIRAAGSAPRSAASIMLDTLVIANDRALLGTGDVPPPLRLLQLELQRDLKRSGVLPLAGYRFQPHCTLAYAPPSARAIGIDPIGWTATEFVLIHSVVGQHEHRMLGRWPLADR